MVRAAWRSVILAVLLAGAAQADEFPAGPQHDLVARTCTQCHDAAQVTSQHLGASQWSAVVRSMIANGAKIADADIEDVVAYLAKNFGQTEAQKLKALEDPPASLPIPWRMVEGLAVDPRPPEKADDEPEFPGQTHAPYHKSVDYRVTTITSHLNRPWAIAFLPDGRFLVTQRLGSMVIVDAAGALSPPLSGVPAVSAELGQGGLLDVVLDTDFAQSRRIFFTYDEPLSGKQNRIVVARATLDEKALALRDVTVIFRARPAVPIVYRSKQGSRIAIGRDGFLYVTIGDRDYVAAPPWDIAQRLNNHLGKVIRITKDGAPAPGNPFIGKPDAMPEIWTYGMRSQEGLTFDSHGTLWEIEDGPRGGDELNIVRKGRNYGWPVVTHGIDYPGWVIGDGITHKAGMEPPRYYWDPTIAPSGLSFYDGKLFAAWKDSLFVGGLRGMVLDRLTLKGTKVVSEEPLLTQLRQRIRDVREGRDGALYVLTDVDSLLKLTPK